MKLLSYLAGFTFVLAMAAQLWAGDTIPEAAWRRPLGLPLDKAGVTRVPGNIDDGYWQTPVGGLDRALFPEATAAILPVGTSKQAFTSTFRFTQINSQCISQLRVTHRAQLAS